MKARQRVVRAPGGFYAIIETKDPAYDNRWREWSRAFFLDKGNASAWAKAQVRMHKSTNPGRRTMTKAQRRAKAKRAGAARRKANAVKAFLKKMNPARKVPAAVKVTRLKGGGFTVKPVRNLGRFRRIVRRTVRQVTRRRARR